MIFEPFDPFEIKRTPTNRIDAKPKILKEFWSDVERIQSGLSDAYGCYVFSVRASRGYRPWYVGKTQAKSGFKGECFQPHKLQHYMDALDQTKKGTPVIHHLARMTPNGKFSKPKRGTLNDIELLEVYLISLALSQNSDLCNVKNTNFQREVIVPGIVNSPKGRPNDSVITLRHSLGLSKPRSRQHKETHSAAQDE